MKTGSILGRYLAKRIAANFAMAFCGILGIIAVSELIEMLRRFAGNPDAGFGFIVQMTLLKLPQTAEAVFPFIVLIAGLLSFWQMSKSNELVVIRVSGVSIWNFLAPVLGITFAIGALDVAALNPVSSYAHNLYETMDYRLRYKNPKAVLFTDKGLWIRESAGGDGFVVLQAKKIHQEASEELFLREITLLEMDGKSQIHRRIEAFAGSLDGGYIQLKDAKIFEAGRPVQQLAHADYPTTLTLARIKDSFTDTEAISFWNLPDTIEFYKKAGFSVLKHQMRYRSLLALPFLACAMMMVAAVFALRPNNRRGGTIWLVAGGIVSGFLVYFLSQVVYALGVNNYIPGALAAWIPALVAGMLSTAALLHLEDG